MSLLLYYKEQIFKCFLSLKLKIALSQIFSEQVFSGIIVKFKFMTHLVT